MFVPMLHYTNMLKLGLFLDSNFNDHLSEHSNIAPVGYWTKEYDIDIKENLLQHFRIDEELINSSDAVFINTNSSSLKLELASKSIKKGVRPILNNPFGLSYSSLSQIHQLALEIGVPINFCQLGHDLDGIDTPFREPFIVHLNRNIETQTMSEVAFHEILYHDLATALKITNLDVRKVRAYSLPQCSLLPSALYVMIDFNNSSVISYTLQTQALKNSIDIQISCGTTCKNYTVSDIIPSQSLEFERCIERIISQTRKENSIELALATARLAEAILSKINQ